MLCIMSKRLFVCACAVVALACHRHVSAPDSFAQSLRCGMTRADVTRLAKQRGYDRSDAQWLSRSASGARARKELMLVDLTFRAGRLVAIRENTYDPRTKRTESRTIDLCANGG